MKMVEGAAMKDLGEECWGRRDTTRKCPETELRGDEPYRRNGRCRFDSESDLVPQEVKPTGSLEPLFAGGMERFYGAIVVPEALRYGNRLQASGGRRPVRDRLPGAFTGDGAQPATWTTDLAEVDSQTASRLRSALKLTRLPGLSLQRFNLPYRYDTRKQLERRSSVAALNAVDEEEEQEDIQEGRKTPQGNDAKLPGAGAASYPEELEALR
ncbi:hypothetical protein MJT46_007454 [Ovis ammon polii x Ovis aries]|nr:hypothetical protein MJT46_007454 [Ovis ammon polii x Ovis aries]